MSTVTQIGVTIPPELLSRVKKYCKETGRTVSGLICILLQREIDKK